MYMYCYTFSLPNNRIEWHIVLYSLSLFSNSFEFSFMAMAWKDTVRFLYLTENSKTLVEILTGFLIEI